MKTVPAFPLDPSTEEGLNRAFVQLRTNHAESANHIGAAGADIRLARHVIEVNPTAINGRNNAFGAENRAVFFSVIKGAQAGMNFLFRKLFRGLNAPAHKNVIRMVVMMVITTRMAVVLIVVVMMMTASATVIVVMVMMVLTAFAIVIVVMVLIVMTAFATVIVIMVMMVLTTRMTVILIVMAMMTMTTRMVVVLIVVVMMVMTAFAAVIIVMIMMVLRCFVGEMLKFSGNGVLSLHRGQKLFAIHFIPWSCNNCRGVVVRFQQGNNLRHLLIAGLVGV